MGLGVDLGMDFGMDFQNSGDLVGGFGSVDFGVDFGFWGQWILGGFFWPENPKPHRTVDFRIFKNPKIHHVGGFFF